MKIFRANAENRMTEVLKGLRSNSTAWRGQYFRLSLLTEAGAADDYTDILLGYIIEQLSDRDGYTFVCADKDVLLLGHSAFKKNFDQIARDLESHIPKEEYLKLVKPLIKTYELGVSWHDVHEMAEKKLANLQNIKKTAVLSGSSNTKFVGLNSSLEPAVIMENYQRLFNRSIDERKKRSKPCILLVEDDPLSLHLAKRALEKNFTIETASSAAEARVAYLSTAPDVVFLDIGLPDLNGHALLNELMTIDHEAYVVMLSGNSFQSDILKAMKMGAKGFIGKPFSRAKLLQYVVQSPHCAENIALADLH